MQHQFHNVCAKEIGQIYYIDDILYTVNISRTTNCVDCIIDCKSIIKLIDG